MFVLIYTSQTCIIIVKLNDFGFNWQNVNIANSNITSFIAYINNAVIKLPIYIYFPDEYYRTRNRSGRDRIKYLCNQFSPGTPVSSTNKTDRHVITEISLKVALNTITP
jgi:hypothetical protein